MPPSVWPGRAPSVAPPTMTLPSSSTPTALPRSKSGEPNCLIQAGLGAFADAGAVPIAGAGVAAAIVGVEVGVRVAVGLLVDVGVRDGAEAAKAGGGVLAAVRQLRLENVARAKVRKTAADLARRCRREVGVGTRAGVGVEAAGCSVMLIFCTTIGTSGVWALSTSCNLPNAVHVRPPALIPIPAAL